MRSSIFFNNFNGQHICVDHFFYRMDNIFIFLAIVGVSILLLSLFYYIFLVLKNGIFDPIVNEIKIKIGLKKRSEIDNQDIELKIEQKQSKVLTFVYNLLKSFN